MALVKCIQHLGTLLQAVGVSQFYGLGHGINIAPCLPDTPCPTTACLVRLPHPLCQVAVAATAAASLGHAAMRLMILRYVLLLCIAPVVLQSAPSNTSLGRWPLQGYVLMLRLQGQHKIGRQFSGWTGALPIGSRARLTHGMTIPRRWLPRCITRVCTVHFSLPTTGSCSIPVVGKDNTDYKAEPSTDN